MQDNCRICPSTKFTGKKQCGWSQLQKNLNSTLALASNKVKTGHVFGKRVMQSSHFNDIRKCNCLNFMQRFLPTIASHTLYDMHEKEETLFLSHYMCIETLQQKKSLKKEFKCIVGKSGVHKTSQGLYDIHFDNSNF